MTSVRLQDYAQTIKNFHQYLSVIKFRTFLEMKTGNGRYREFLQADFDIVGNVNPAQANAELCNLISSTLFECD